VVELVVTTTATLTATSTASTILGKGMPHESWPQKSPRSSSKEPRTENRELKTENQNQNRTLSQVQHNDVASCLLPVASWLLPRP